MQVFSHTLNYYGDRIKIDFSTERGLQRQETYVLLYISGYTCCESPSRKTLFDAPPYEYLIGLPVIDQAKVSRENLYLERCPYGSLRLKLRSFYSGVEVCFTLTHGDSESLIRLRDTPLALWSHLEMHLGCSNRDSTLNLGIENLSLLWGASSHCYSLCLEARDTFFTLQRFGKASSALLRQSLREVCGKIHLLITEKDK